MPGSSARRRAGEVQRLRVLEPGQARRGGADLLPDQALPAPDAVQRLAELRDVGRLRARQPLQRALVFDVEGAPLAVQRRRARRGEDEVALGEHRQEAARAIALEDMEGLRGPAQLHQHVDRVVVVRCEPVAEPGARLVRAAQRPPLRVQRVERAGMEGERPLGVPLPAMQGGQALAPSASKACPGAISRRISSARS